MRKLCISLLLVALCLNQAQAQAASQPAAKQPHDMEKMWQAMLARPAMAVAATFDEQGRLWRGRVRDGYLLVSYSDDVGASYSTPVRVNPEPEALAADGENTPKLIAKGGVLYVSYTRSLEKPMTGDIRFSRSLDGGESFSVPITVNDNREVISHRFDAMAVNGKGQIYIAWLDKRDQSAARKAGGEYLGAALYYAVSEDGGKSFRNNVKIADHACECCRTAMALDSDGVPVVVWRHIFDTNIRDHAVVKLDAQAMPVRMSHENWNVAACPHHGPSVSITREGVYHAAWFSNAPQRQGLFYANSIDKGKTFSAPLSFGNSAMQASHPAVLGLGKKVYLVWKEFDGEHTTILLKHSIDGGQAWSAPASLASTSDASENPSLISGRGHVFLSWNTKNEGHRMIEVGE